jgi:hypothetical protein
MHLQKITLFDPNGMLFKDSQVRQHFNFDHQHPMNYLGITAQIPSPSVSRGTTLSPAFTSKKAIAYYKTQHFHLPIRQYSTF